MSKYTTATRQKNKSKKLNKALALLKIARESETINPNTKLPPKRRPLENIIKSCRIGRTKEGFKVESFKQKSQKNSVLLTKETK